MSKKEDKSTLMVASIVTLVYIIHKYIIQLILYFKSCKLGQLMVPCRGNGDRILSINAVCDIPATSTSSESVFSLSGSTLSIDAELA